MNNQDIQERLDEILHTHAAATIGVEPKWELEAHENAKAAIEQLISDRIVEARIEELRILHAFTKRHHIFDQDSAMKLSYHIKERLEQLKQSGGVDGGLSPHNKDRGDRC